jgi:branched-chain amino acid transport system ATP-binding protein
MMEEKKNGILLEGREVTKYFGGLAAVSDVSFDVKQGEILGIIGPNGAGKTTLFNVIAGVYRPNRGKIFFRGQVISYLPPTRSANWASPAPSRSPDLSWK